VILSPDQYASASAYDLLTAAALGQAGVDRRLVSEIVRRGDAVLPDLLRFVGENRENDRFDLTGDVVAIIRHLRTPAALPLLEELVRQHEFTFSDEASQAFWEIGSASLETLFSLFRESKQPDLLFMAAGLRVRDPRLIEELLVQLRENPLDAALSLGLYADPAALPPLREALEKAPPEDRILRSALEDAIREIESAEPAEPIPAFDVLTDLDEEVEPRFAALSETELLEFLASPLAAYRALAVRTLALDEVEPELATRFLDLARNDPDEKVRATCWESLDGSLKVPGVQEAIEARLTDPAASIEERGGALVALATGDPDFPGLHDMILAFYRAPGGRAQALKAMWRSADRRFAQYIASNLDDPDLEVRRQTITAAGFLGVTGVLRQIEECFDDDDLRESSLYSYALLSPGETSPARMRSLFRKIEELAGELSETDEMVIRDALDVRLQMHGLDPLFVKEASGEEDGEEWDGEREEDDPPLPPAPPPGRNDPCPCGSGKKYKKCCGL
jgi:HEAT repeat protein